MKVGIIAFSEKGLLLGKKLMGYFNSIGSHASITRCKNGALETWAAAHFVSDDALIFIGSAGIAVRAVAPYLKSKLSDPAVVAIDELGAYCIPLLSGHIGGANELALEIARLLKAVPIVTTATDCNGVFSVDTWAKKQGFAIINPEGIKGISSRLLAGGTVRLNSKFPVEDTPPAGIELTDGPGDILVTWRTRGEADVLRLVPPVVTLGVGCKKGVDTEALEAAFLLALAKANCHSAAVKQVCSIDLKANEPGLLEFCRRHSFSFQTFSASSLADVSGEFSSSAFVRSVTGVDNVCERSAILGSGEKGRLLTHKNAAYGVTTALAIEPYVIRFCETGEAK